ncbi:MAG: hypothetical protein P4M15_10530 [Alphaproteobacteria bacterium]|nr:hypothetical protein [Alphaproteobacteria bacterium]
MNFTREPKIAAPIIHAIEDAVLFGNIKEIAGILDMVREDSTFPENLRNALESLMYFRIAYGKGGAQEPVTEEDRQAKLRMESSWGKEIIDMIGHYPDMSEVNYA